MVTFRNNTNNRRGSFRRNDNRGFKRNGDGPKFKSDFSSSSSFQRKVPGRNNHNASKLIEKYNDLAREALASEDKILSENYFQHADHFKRILNTQEENRSPRVVEANTNLEEKSDKLDSNSEEKVAEKSDAKVAEKSETRTVEKRIATNS